ncbi:unnamed protein product, partial [marine sediment metagenome]
PDLTARIDTSAEQISDALHDNDYFRDEMLEEHGYTLEQFEESPYDLAHDIAKADLVGDAGGGVVYPLKINRENYATIGGKDSTRLQGRDYYEEAKADINKADYADEADYDDAVQELSYEMQNNDDDGLYAQVYNALRETDAYQNEEAIGDVMEALGDSFNYGEVDIDSLDEAIRAHITDNYDDSTGELISAGEISSQTLKNLGYEGVIDNTVNSKFGSGRQYGQSMAGVESGTQHIITFPGGEHNLRSTTAAFDPS